MNKVFNLSVAEENESVVHSAASDKLNTLFMIVTP